MQWFQSIFDTAVRQTPATSEKEDKIPVMIKFFTELFYRNVSRSIFQRHVFLMSFNMVIALQLDSGAVSDKHYKCFLNGIHTSPKGDVHECPVKWIEKHEWSTTI